ncbi:MAG: peroxiredoxin, partial [Gammaproteobacteria bacterium]|nr:peroxiredoxin [Gammaproteobacteria bacterium]
MSKVEIGKKIPVFSAPTADGSTWRSADAKGKKLVLYFYPKDMTSGCTLEARDFRDLLPAFRRAATLVVGVSRDSCASHQKFAAKERLNFPLLADEDETLCRLFDVIRE